MPKTSTKISVSLQLALVASFMVILAAVVSPAVGQTENTNAGTNPTQTSIPVTWRIIWQGLANYLAKSNSPEQERLAGNFYQIRGNRSHPVEPLQSLYLCENTM